MKEVLVNGIIFSNARALKWILGPCVIESESSLRATARALARIAGDTGIQWIFKSSYDKANRTSLDSYRGPGIKRGIDILERVKKELGITVLVDVHETGEVRHAARTADILQIPAFLCRQTDLLLACGDTGRCVNIKKGQFLSADDIEFIIKKIESTGNKNILITERGSCFGYRDLVVDMRGIEIMKRFGYPVIFDATHSAQKPAAGRGTTSGDRSMVPVLARASCAVGIAGIFMEVHRNPARALSDAQTVYPLNRVSAFIRCMTKLDKAVKNISFTAL